MASWRAKGVMLVFICKLITVKVIKS